MSLIPTPTLPPPFEILLIPYYITTFQPAKKELLCMNVTDDQKGFNLLRDVEDFKKGNVKMGDKTLPSHQVSVFDSVY